MSFRARLLDRERQLGRPLRVGLVGAGQMGRGFAAQLGRTPGVQVSAIADVQLERAQEALASIGSDIVAASSSNERVRAVEGGGSVAVADADELVALPIDVVVEATGIPDVGARVILSSLLAGRDVAQRRMRRDDWSTPAPAVGLHRQRLLSVPR